MNLSQALKGLPHEDVAQGRPLDGQLSLPSCVDPRPGGTTEVSGRAPGPSPQAAETRTYPGADLPCSEPLSRPFRDGELVPYPLRRVYPPPASSPSVGRPASTPGSCLVPGPPPRAPSAARPPQGQPPPPPRGCALSASAEDTALWLGGPDPPPPPDFSPRAVVGRFGPQPPAPHSGPRLREGALR